MAEGEHAIEGIQRLAGAVIRDAIEDLSLRVSRDRLQATVDVRDIQSAIAFFETDRVVKWFRPFKIDARVATEHLAPKIAAAKKKLVAREDRRAAAAAKKFARRLARAEKKKFTEREKKIAAARPWMRRK